MTGPQPWLADVVCVVMRIRARLRQSAVSRRMTLTHRTTRTLRLGAAARTGTAPWYGGTRRQASCWRECSLNARRMARARDRPTARPAQAIGGADPIWDLGEEDDDEEDEVAAATAKRAAGWDIPDVLWEVRPYAGPPAGRRGRPLADAVPARPRTWVAAPQGPAVPASDALVIGVGGVGAAALHVAYGAGTEAVASLRTPKRPVWARTAQGSRPVAADARVRGVGGAAGMPRCRSRRRRWFG